MTNHDILKIAMAQSALEANCKAEDFVRSENIITESRDDPKARKYLRLPHTCNLISYGSNIVATVAPQYRSIVAEYLERYSLAHCFETPNLYSLNDALESHGLRACFMAEYFLPDVDRIPSLSCKYSVRLLNQADFAELYRPEWSNALCADRKELDVLGIGAYDGEKLVGLAACSADCDSMWQIGVDVLPEYRRQGIASALTCKLAMEILARGKVPFYCCAWSNLCSVRNALKSGFRPAWVELTVKPVEFVREMNEN